MSGNSEKSLTVGTIPFHPTSGFGSQMQMELDLPNLTTSSESPEGSFSSNANSRRARSPGTSSSDFTGPFYLFSSPERKSSALKSAKILWMTLAATLFAAFLIYVMAAFFIGSAEASCGVYLELGAGYDHSLDEGRNPMSVIRARLEDCKFSPWAPDIYEFNHHSSFQNGWPFNDKPEDLVNQYSVIWRFRLWP